MPFTVSCTACATRFLLSDDLFRRRVSGNVVTVKCRNCNAEISVDARDVDTMPSQEPPRRAPAPPRPKDKTVIIAPKPISDEAGSIWDSAAEQTVSIGGKAAPTSQEAEFVDFEEIPASSSDAPAHNVLTHEPARVHPPRRNRPADDFLVNLSAGTGGILGAPTIDVSGLGAPPPPSIEELDIEPEEVSTQRTGTVPLPNHGGTIPLFDMSAVLPAANPSATLGSASSAPMQIDIDVGPLRAKAPVSAGTVRERKYVVAPKDAPAEQKSRRGGVLVWLGVAAVAAGVLAVVGLRGHRAPQPVVSEPQPAEHSAVLSNAAPSVEGVPTSAPVVEASSAPEAASAAPSVALPNNAGSTMPATTNSAVKSAAIAHEPTEPAEAPKAEAAIATEKPTTPTAPATPAAPVEIHNALPPAAPGTEFDRSAAVSALKGAAAQASSCRKDGDPSGSATLVITFAPSGRVTSATIQGPPFAGTPTGGCIANTMRHAQIPSFDGDRVTVTKTVVIE